MSKPDALALADSIDPVNKASALVLTIHVSQAAAELRRLHAENKRMCEVEALWLKHRAEMIHEANALRAEVEALRKYKAAAHLIAEDAGRFQWMQDHALAIDTVADPDNQVQIWHGTDPARRTYGKTLSEAVDAAMKEANHG